jgi:transposase InsO family protein
MECRQGHGQNDGQERLMTGDFSRHTWRNGYVESFNSRVRDECLNINIFWSLTQARVIISDWKHEYNHHRPHSALDYQPPARYAASCMHR